MSRVLLLFEYPTLNGGEQSILAMLDAVGQARLTVIAMAPPAGPLADALRARAIEVLPFLSHDPAGGRRPQAELRQELAAAIRRQRPDLVHANSLSMGRLSGPVVVETGTPSIAHLRDIIHLSPQAIADLNCHTRLLAVSEATRRFHAANGLETGKTHVLHNGVDLNRFCPRPRTGYLHRELGLTPDTPLVATIGQIGLRKGQDVLLAAALEVVARTPGAHYLIVGQRWSDKDESRRLEAELHAAAEGSLTGRVHFLGVRDDVDRLLNEVDMLVHPARQEPLGRVLLEAAASGVAVVATDVGGTREIFPSECQAACLVPPDDAARLAAAMVELLNDAALRARLGAAARCRAQQAFDVRRTAAGLVRHYREVVALLQGYSPESRAHEATCDPLQAQGRQTLGTSGVGQSAADPTTRSRPTSPEPHPASLPVDELLAQCDVERLRRSGPGGQHRNKVETAVRLVHQPTGVRAEASRRRSQAENRQAAIGALRINLAVEVRRTWSAEVGPSPRWQSRLGGGRLNVSASHEDFPALLAEALDSLAAFDQDVPRAAAALDCTASQLIRLLKKEPRALAQVNQSRRERGLHDLQ